MAGTMKVGDISAEVRAVVNAGTALIGSDRSDAEIRDEIREAAGGDARLLAKAARHIRLWDEEVDWYGSDRTKRVFDAAASGSAVAAPDPAMVETFRREKALEVAPRDEAVRELWRLSGNLEVWCRRVRAEAEARPEPLTLRQAVKLSARLGDEMAGVVGNAVEDAGDPLLRSPVARRIIGLWVDDASGVGGALLPSD